MTLDGFDAVLPTFALLARFRLEPGMTATDLVGRLTSAEMPFHEVAVERVEPDGTVLVEVRFVEASVDGHTAVGGLYETLSAAGLVPDEVWLDRTVA